MPTSLPKRRNTSVNQETPTRLFGLFIFAFVIGLVAWGAADKSTQQRSLVTADHISSKTHQVP